MSPTLGESGNESPRRPRTTGRAGRPIKLTIRWYWALPVVLLLCIPAFVLFTADDDADEESVAEAILEPPVAVLEPPAPEELAAGAANSLPTRAVILYWPALDASGLVAQDAEVFDTASIGTRVKQVVGLLFRGPVPPEGADAEEGEAGVGDETELAEQQRPITAPFPPGVGRLRHVFVDDRGTAHVSLARSTVERAPGGSNWESLAVYSVVNSVVRSFPEIVNVQLLIDGAEAETFTGHLDIRRPLAFSERMLAPELDGQASPRRPGQP